MQQKISNDLKEALKSGDSFRVGVLRMIAAAFKNKEIEKKGKEKIRSLLKQKLLIL